MIEKEILQEIIEWLGNDTSYLSTRTDYAKGYKDGIEQAKGSVELLFKIVFIMRYLCTDTIAG